MLRVIGIGVDKIEWFKVISNWQDGTLPFSKKNFKTRPVVGFVHAFVAGVFLYLLVNVFDVLYGFIPNFNFYPIILLGIFIESLWIFSVLVLLGVFYFLARRFILKDSRLQIRNPVLVSDSALKGMKFDSLLVGTFIIVHVGSRFLSASFEIAEL